MSLTTYNYSFRIVCEENDAPNPVHLCEELQAYLNSNLSYYDDESGDHVNAEVTGYDVTRDNFNPFISEEDY